MIDRRPKLYIQLGLFVLLTCVSVFTPSRGGAMLLIPLGAKPGDVIGAAISHGARLLAAGPVPGSFIIEGDRDKLFSVMLNQGTIVIAAAPVICGSLPGSIGSKRS